MHPATWLIVWLAFVIVLESLEGLSLLAAVAIWPLIGQSALRRTVRLVWQARWFLLSLFIILAWGGVGEPLWEGILAPTREGCVDALTHLGRLLLMFIAVALLCESLSAQDLLTAMHQLLRPIRLYGINPDRLLIRLLLVLRQMETRSGPSDWRRALFVPEPVAPEVFDVAEGPLAWVDRLTMFVVAVTMALLWLVVT